MKTWHRSALDKSAAITFGLTRMPTLWLYLALSCEMEQLRSSLRKVLIELIGPYSCRIANNAFGEDSMEIVPKVDFGQNSFFPWTKTAGPYFGKREETFE